MLDRDRSQILGIILIAAILILLAIIRFYLRTG